MTTTDRLPYRITSLAVELLLAMAVALAVVLLSDRDSSQTMTSAIVIASLVLMGGEVLRQTDILTRARQRDSSPADDSRELTDDLREWVESSRDLAGSMRGILTDLARLPEEYRKQLSHAAETLSEVSTESVASMQKVASEATLALRQQDQGSRAFSEIFERALSMWVAEVRSHTEALNSASRLSDRYVQELQELQRTLLTVLETAEPRRLVIEYRYPEGVEGDAETLRIRLLERGADALIARGEYQAAIEQLHEAFENALKLEPGVPGFESQRDVLAAAIAMRLGDAFRKREDVEEALAWYERARRFLDQ